MAGIGTIRWNRRFAFSLGAATGALLLLCMAAAMLIAAPAADAAPASDPYIVVLKDDVAHPANVAERHEENRGADVEHIYGAAIEGYSAELAPGELKAIRQDPTVDYVVPDGVLHVDAQTPSTGIKRVFAPNNPKLDIDEIDDVRVDADVAILDTGVALHPDLNVVSRVTCVNESETCVTGGEDVYVHGTHVAGIVGALDNNFGVVGSAPGARIWSVKVLNDSGDLERDFGEENQMSDALAGINWVTARSAQIEVVNLSWGCYEDGECQGKPLREAIAASVNKGVVYVVSAGNDDVSSSGEGTPGDPYYNAPDAPASFPDVITVSALEDSDGEPGGIGGSPLCKYSGAFFDHSPLQLAQDDYLAKFSNWGPAIDIAAPGTCIESTLPGGKYGLMSGTSMSSPMVAGTAATLAAVNNPSNRTDVEGIRNYLRALGNYNWIDEHQVRKGKDPSEYTVVPDGVKEPLLTQGTIPPPVVTTNEPTAVSQTKATLNGSVNPSGVPTTYYLEWGPTTYYGNTFSSSAGSGTSAVGVSKVVEGLYPGTTYHYRVRAASAGGSVSGVDKQFTTPKQPTVFLSDAGRGASMTRWAWDNSIGWQQTPMNGDAIAVGTKPAPIMLSGTPHVFFNDASAGNTIADWSRNGSTGQWEMNRFYGAQLAPKSSPSAVVANGVAHVFFVDASRNNTISDWVLKNPTSGWEQVPFYGDSVTPGSSPSAIAYGLNAQAYFSDASKSNTVAVWSWSPSAIQQQFFYGDALSAGSSPSAVINGSNPQIYFSDAAKSNTIGVWTWTPTALTPQFFYGDALSAGSSPSAVMNGSNPQIYFSDAAKSNTIGVWTWTPTALTPQFFNGHALSAGSSPSAVMNGTTPEIYFADATNSNTVSVWKWTPTALTMTPLFGPSVSTGSSPAAMLLG